MPSLSLLVLLVIGGCLASPRVSRQASNKSCVCVPYYQCDSNNIVDVYGTDVIDPRIPLEGETCEGLDTCCFLPDDYDERKKPEPDRTREPPVEPPVQPPVQPPIQPPVKPPVQPPVQPPVKPPVQPPVHPPVHPPVTDSFVLVPDRPQGLTGCGLKRVSPLNSRITEDDPTRITGVDGRPEETFFGEFPWMIALLTDAGSHGMNYTCGGSLIAPNIVLTAAHCVSSLSPSVLLAVAGEWDSRVDTEPVPHQTRKVSKIVVHEDFNSGNLINDIALLFLERAFEESVTVDVVCLVKEFKPVNCQATGWGVNQFKRGRLYQPILRKVGLPIVERNECQEKLRTTRLGKYFRLHKSFVCAGGVENADTCTGDGGGPLVCAAADGDPGRYAQVGIVSWGIECGTNVPGVYTSIGHFYDWIKHHTGL